MKRPPNSDTEEDGGTRKRQHLQPDSTLQLPIPDLRTITPWSLSEIPSELPPLPEISDPELELAAFTHPGVGHGPNYERLEWLGDAYLEMIATVLIFQSFPNTTAGRSSQIREQLIRNTTLAEYFRQYKMEKRARLPSDLGTMEQLLQYSAKSKDVLKIQGDIFEAFVAAAILSDPVKGHDTVITWLKAIWGRTIRSQIQSEERAKKLAQSSGGGPGASMLSTAKSVSTAGPKEHLANTLVVRGVRLRYEDMPNNNKKDKNLGLPLFTVGVYMDGWGETNKLLGFGTALKKKEAGQKAAVMALENKKFMNLYGDKKRAFVQTQHETGIKVDSACVNKDS